MSFFALLAVGLGFCLIIEGTVYALFPRQFKNWWEMVQNVPPETIRLLGVAAFGAGVAIVWLVI